MQKTCIVVPCYNEAERLDRAFIGKYLKANPDVVMAFVNDGSSDNTAEVLRAFQNDEPSIIVIDFEKNRGKAEAVRQGMLQVERDFEFEYLGFWDADLATPLDELRRMIAILDNDEELKLVLGSRVQRLGARIERNSVRHYFGRVFSTIATFILQFPVYDTQCGSKLFRTSIVKELFDEPFISKWLFDIELLLRVRNGYGTSRLKRLVMELPLNAWEEKGDSRLKTSHLLSMPKQFVQIHKKYN